MRLDDMMRNVDVADFPNKAIYLEEIGRAYYRFGDYEQAIPYFKTVAALPASDFYLPSWRHAINTMGLTYRQLGLLDQSDSCFRQLITHATDVSEQWVGIASGNLGYNEYLRGNYDDAVPLFEKDIRIAEQYDDPGLAAGSAMPLADVLLQRGQVAAAKASLDKAYAYIQESRQYDRLREWYPIMSKWYTAVGQQQVAAQYLDSALEANKRYAEKFNALKLMRANQEIMASRQEAALERLHAEAARQRVRRNAIVAGLVLAAFAILVLYGITVYRNRIRRKLQESELERAHHELDSARRLLEGYASRILSNARIIQSMEGTEPERDDPALRQLRTATILTDADWIDFRTQFQKVYPGVTERLTEQHPDLTPAELRYLFLLKLELSNHEIAHALGISPASLPVTWHRIRKKIGLSASFTPPMFYTDYFVGN
ncbi:tetratricopeptide repeat protein [Parapedobacter soli]|uniref:tetratricopeptide repeat protein n=1 Tax=Parapedobacter soli TaxID=416955 RepID=UPI0021C9886E|nr:tetratricopeptide repeat protein [Parapedobacter soli]